MSTVRDLINLLLIYPPEEIIAYLVLTDEDVKTLSEDVAEVHPNVASRALTIAQAKFNKREGSILDVLGKAVLKALREEEDAKLNMDRYSNWLK